MNRLIAACSAALLATTLAACSGGGGGDCIDLSSIDAAAVQSGADGTLTVGAGSAVKADSGVYYLAFKVEAPKGSPGVAVWATDTLFPVGALRSVDGIAQQFTRWPVLPGANGSETARAAQACL